MRNVHDNFFEVTKRQTRGVQKTAPVGYSSITRGALRVASEEGLIVEGSANVTGQLIGSGAFDWTGPCYLKGDTTVSGTFGVTGDTTVSGSLTISNDLDVTGTTRLRGDTTLENDLTLTDDGKLIVGDMTIDPSAGAGRIRFGNGARVAALSNGVNIIMGAAAVTVSSTYAQIQHGSMGVKVTSNGVEFMGLPTITGTGATPGTLWVNGAGIIHKVDS